MQTPHQRDVVSNDHGEAGYMLIAVVVMTALAMIALSVAAPMVARDIRRDKEVESEMRAQQYVRAIRLYQRKFPGQYPASIDALEKTNNIRFLRQQYVDPLTGKADWRIIHLGQQQTTIKIPFGQELAGLATTGIGGGAAPAGGLGASPGSSSTIGSTSPLAGGFLGAQSGSSGSTGSTGVKSTDAGSFGGGGGGPIVGVGTSRTGESILNPNEQTSYDTWEFWYDPRIELLYKGSNILGGGGLGGGTGSGGINSVNSSSFGTDINGKSNSTKNPGSGSGTSGTTPQQ